MITENLSTLKIHKLTQAQYQKLVAEGKLEENVFYLTPEEAKNYATEERVLDLIKNKTDSGHKHSISDITNLQKLLDEKEGAGAANSALEAAKTYVNQQLQDFATKSYVNNLLSSGILPPVTNENNGSVLGVVNGEWAVTTFINAEEVEF